MNIKHAIIKRKILNMDDLPTLSVSALHILKMLNNSETPQGRLVNAIHRDPSICTGILRMINSGLYGMKTQVNSIKQAVNLLGPKPIRDLVMSVSVMDIISGTEKDIWLHSYSTALLIRDLLESNDLDVSPDLEVATLLHDIGRIVLMNFSPENYNLVQKEVVEKNISIEEAEEHRLGVTHDLASSWLLESWGIPESVRIPVEFHHQRKLPEIYTLESALLAIADYIDLRARKMTGSMPSKNLMNAVGIDGESIERLISYQETLASDVDKSSHLNTEISQERDKSILRYR